MYIVILVQQVFSYTQYLPIQNQYIEANMDYDPQQIEEYGIGYGVWMRYCPLMKVGQVGNILQNQSNNSLLTYIRDVDTSQIQMVVQLTSDYENLFMKFEAFVYSNTYTHHIQHQLDYMNFEGLWYIFYFQCKPVLQKCQFLFSDFNVNQTIYEINEEYPFQSQNLKIIVGGGLKQDQYLLTYFPGIMRYETFDQQYGWYDDINAGYFFSYSQQFDRCWGFSQIYDDIIFKSDSRIKMDQTQSNVNGYELQAWYRLVQVQPVGSNVNIIRVSQNGYQDFLNYIGGNAFGYSISWDFVSTQAKLTTYSYNIPMINLDLSNGDPFQINKVNDLLEDLNQWAYLQFSFSLRNNKLLFQINYPLNKYSYVNPNARQFSRPLSTVFIGNNYFDYSEQQGIVKSFSFISCEGLDEINDKLFCDPTCGTCFGPYNYQCLSCDPQSLRVYQSLSNSCSCNIGYVDTGYQQCFGQNSEVNIVYEQSYECVWGQFIYNNKCFYCPNYNKDNVDINCLECLENPKTWIYDPYCYTTYQQIKNEPNKVFRQFQEKEKQYYMLQEGQLIGVSNVAVICDENDIKDCHYFPIQHLDKPTYIQCLGSYTFYENQCVECYDPFCVECVPVYLNLVCAKCQGSYEIDSTTKRCAFNWDECNADKCPQYCDQFCTFCSHDTRNCKTCISGYYVGFDYRCHQCNIKNCLKCFEFNIYDVNENTLNFRFQSIDYSYIVVGCVECGEGLIYDFVLQICKPHKQVEPCLQSYINLNSIEVCTLERGKQFSVIAPQIDDCTVLKQNCQICIKVSGSIQCVKCIDGYYADTVFGTCVLCGIGESISCVQYSYQDQDQFMNKYQGFYSTFRTDGLIYSSQVWFPAISPTNCQQGYVIFSDYCIKLCDSNCKTCVFYTDMVYICEECYPQNGFPVLSLVDGQCQKCPYLCAVCHQRTTEQIKNINNRFIYSENNKYLTYACIKAYQDYAIDNTLQVVKYYDDQIDKGDINIFQNVDFYCGFDYYDFGLSYYHFEESQTLIDFLNIRQPYSYTYNITLRGSGSICSFSEFKQETILKKQVFILNKLVIKFLGSGEYNLWSQLNFNIIGFDQVYLENFYFQFSDNQIFQLLDGEYEFFAKNMTFSNYGQSTIVTNLLIQNATNVNFDIAIFNQYYVQNSIFMNLEQENSLIINMTRISFYNCTFNNFTMFKTNSNLKQLNVYLKSVVFVNCSLINFQFIENTFYTKNSVDINHVTVQYCSFINTSLFNQLTSGNLLLQNLQIYDSNLTNSSIISLYCNSIIRNLIIQQCNLYGSKIISLNTVMSSINQVNLTISNISISNIAYDSSRLIELDSYNFFKFNLIIDNINFKYNQLSNVDKNLFQGFWVIRCQILEISNVQIIRKYLNNIEFMLVNVTNIRVSNVSVISDGVNSSSNALIAVDQFQEIHFENFIIQDQQVVDQPIIFITSESQIQLFSIQQERIIIQNMTFSSNILKKTIQGKFESMIYIISNHYQIINIQHIHFKNNFIMEQIQNNLIDSSGLLFISSQYASLILQHIFSYNDTIVNTTNTLFYIQSQTVQLSYFETYRVNQEVQTQSSVGVLILISNIMNLKNIQVNQVQSQIIGFMNLQSGQQGIINIDNMTIQGIQTQNNDPFAIEESIIQIDQKISQLSLNVTNVIINSCVLGSGGFLRINLKKMQNSIRLVNITLNNLFTFKCQLLCMVLNSLIQQYNNLDIQNITLVNQNGYELDLFFKNKINTYLQDLQNLLNLNNSFIEASYTNITINNLFIAGPLYVGYFLLTNMQDIILNQLTLVNSNIISATPLQFLMNNGNYKVNLDFASKFILNNVLMSNISVNQLQNRRLLQQQPLYGQSFIQISQIQNKNSFQIQNLLIQQITCNTCSEGFFIINILNGGNMHLNMDNFILNNNECGLANCIIISNSQMNESNILRLNNSLLFSNQATTGLIQITNISLSFHNVTIINNTALINGSTITYVSNQTIWNNVQVIENLGIQSGGLITQSTDFLELKQSQISFLFNDAKQQPDNLLCQATNLIFLFQNIYFKSISNKINTTIFNTPDIKKYFQFPNTEDKISKYQIYDLQKEEYVDANLKYDIFASNKFMEVFSQYQNKTCKLNIFNNESNITYSQNLQLSNQMDGSTFDTMYFRSNPYQNQLMVVTIQCDFIQNYKYVLYAKSLPCQLGEYYFNQTCKTCDYVQGYYSVSFNATSCSKADTSLILNNTSNNLQLQKYYWRPSRLNPYVEFCHQNKINCLGGWQTGDQSCLKGHLGALCEQCDIYNIRGDGQFSQNYGVICVNCGSSGIQVLTIIGTLIWTLISAFVTVRSIIQSNLKLKQLKKLNRKFFQILFRQDQDQSSTLLKMAIYDMQIIQAIYTFQINFSFNMSSFNDFVSYPVESVTYNIECNLSQISEIPIIYFRIIWILFITMFTIVLFIMLYLFFLVIKKQRYESVVIYTSLLYMFVYIQPYIMRQVSSLVASRTISNLKWIQGNVSYRYDTTNHYKWIAGFAVPVIITFGVTIPLLFFILLFRFRKNLYFDVVRNKIGYLYNEYRQHSFYWENVKILHMQLIIFILTIYQDEIQLKACIIYLIVFLYYVLQQDQQPYNQSRLNKFDNQMIFVIGVCLILSQAIYSSQQSNLLGFKQVLEIVLNLLLVYIYINFLTRIIFAVFQRLDSQIDTLKDLIKSKGVTLRRLAPGFMRYLTNRAKQKARVQKRFQLIRNYLIGRVKGIKNYETVLKSQQIEVLVSPKSEENHMQFNQISQQEQLFSIERSIDSSIIEKQQPYKSIKPQ